MPKTGKRFEWEVGLALGRHVFGAHPRLRLGRRGAACAHWPRLVCEADRGAPQSCRLLRFLLVKSVGRLEQLPRARPHAARERVVRPLPRAGPRSRWRARRARRRLCDELQGGARRPPRRQRPGHSHYSEKLTFVSGRGNASAGWRIDGSEVSPQFCGVMNTAATEHRAPSPAEKELLLAERLALAREIVATPRFRALCFWNWPAAIDVTEESLPSIASALQVHGGRSGFQLGAKLCPTPQSRKKYFGFSARTETPRAT